MDGVLLQVRVVLFEFQTLRSVLAVLGGYPEGVMFSILIMNAVAPLLNNITVRKYGYGKKGNRKPEPRKIVQDFDVKNAKEVPVNE